VRELLPGQRYVDRLTFSYPLPGTDERRLAPGEYEITVEYYAKWLVKGASRDVQSNVVKIKVVPP